MCLHIVIANTKAIRLNVRLLLPSQTNPSAGNLGPPVLAVSGPSSLPLLSPVSSVSPFVDAFPLAYSTLCHHMFKECLSGPHISLLLSLLPQHSSLMEGLCSPPSFPQAVTKLVLPPCLDPAIEVTENECLFCGSLLI